MLLKLLKLGIRCNGHRSILCKAIFLKKMIQCKINSRKVVSKERKVMAKTIPIPERGKALFPSIRVNEHEGKRVECTALRCAPRDNRRRVGLVSSQPIINAKKQSPLVPHKPGRQGIASLHRRIASSDDISRSRRQLPIDDSLIRPSQTPNCRQNGRRLDTKGFVMSWLLKISRNG